MHPIQGALDDQMCSAPASNASEDYSYLEGLLPLQQANYIL